MKVLDTICPPPAKSEDGRDQWPSRAAFLLAAMGGCAGQGNLLRYPSVVYNNYGVQWFIPYLLAVTLVAIPALVIEISIGQAYRGGSVIAFNNIHRRLKGVGMGSVFVSFVVVQYFTVNLAWIMVYFRNSFTSPLPWEGRIDDFYNNDVIANPPPGPDGEGGYVDGSTVVYQTYPGVSLIGETVGWSAFVWFLIWFSIFRGVGTTGQVVYFTMGLPIVTTIILVGRSVSLDNAGAGLKLLWGTWRGEVLRDGTIWQTAVGQVFFSTGVGFGYFTSYASYNQKHSNAVMDAVLICGSNVLFENFAALAIFGIVGFLRRWPWESDRLGAFVVGFLTLPEAVLQMPGANFWAILLFFTLIVLGFSSAFVMLDVVATLLVDSGLKYSRPQIVTALTLASFLMCLPYCTEFGYYLLDGIDRWMNNVLLISVVWAEVTSASTVYRYKDVVSQTGKVPFAIYNFGMLFGQFIGVVVAHVTGEPGFGAAAGAGLFAVCAIIATTMATTVEPVEMRFWKSETKVGNMLQIFFSRIYYLGFYSVSHSSSLPTYLAPVLNSGSQGNQLRRDLNLIVGGGKNWRIPIFLPVLLRYISSPVLFIILSFAVPEFHQMRYDPLMILGFIASISFLIFMLIGFFVPRFYEPFIPVHRRAEGTEETVVNELKQKDSIDSSETVEVVSPPSSVLSMFE